MQQFDEMRNVECKETDRQVYLKWEEQTSNKILKIEDPYIRFGEIVTQKDVSNFILFFKCGHKI